VGDIYGDAGGIYQTPLTDSRSRPGDELPTTRDMTSRELIILAGLALAACGHLLVHELLGVASAWVRIDARFPAASRSSPVFAGACLLVLGAVFVLVPALG
jgi:hypothetical protein